MWKTKENRKLDIVKEQIALLKRMNQEDMLSDSQLKEGLSMWNKVKGQLETTSTTETPETKTINEVPEVKVEEKPETTSLNNTQGI